MEMTMTYHYKVERKERREFIEKEIGFGQIIKKVYHNGTWNCLTDTGIMMILDDDQKTIITAFCPRVGQLKVFYGDPNKAPKAIRKKVYQHESKYLRDGRMMTKWGGI